MIVISYFLKHKYDVSFENEESTDEERSVDLSDIPATEVEEKVKEKD